MARQTGHGGPRTPKGREPRRWTRAEIWFTNSLTAEPYPIYSSPYTPPQPDHVVLSFSKTVVIVSPPDQVTSSDGIAIADNTDTLTVNLQIAGADGTPLPYSKNIYVTVNNGATITAVNAGSTINGGATSANIITSAGGLGFLTMKKPPPAGTVNVIAYWNGVGSSSSFGSASSGYADATFLVNNSPTIRSEWSQTFNVGDASTVLFQIHVTDSSAATSFAAGQAIRIRIPAGLDCVFDQTMTTPGFSVQGTGTVGATVTYPDSKTVRIPITGTFAPQGLDVPSVLLITNLRVMNFASASSGLLELSWDNGATYPEEDSMSHVIVDPTPYITGIETVDMNGNGFLDAVHIIFSKNIKDTTITAAAAGFTVAGASGLAVQLGDERRHRE